MSIGIYKITSPSGKIYIGQSTNIEKRFERYKKLNKYDLNNQPRIYNSLKKHKPNNHIFEIIEECKLEELNIRERYWQDYYDVLGPNGLNCILTQTDELPKIFSQKTKNKISENKKGHPMFTEEWKEKISKGNLGKIRTDEHKLNYSNASLGKVKSDDFKQLMSNIHKGKTTSNETKLKMSESHKGKTITEEHKNILSQIHKGNQYLKGIRYSDESKKKISESKSTKIICIETLIIYDNTRCASENMSISPTLINSSCKSGISAKGFHFKKLQ
jgi:group I intron endonuclease